MGEQETEHVLKTVPNVISNNFYLIMLVLFNLREWAGKRECGGEAEDGEKNGCGGEEEEQKKRAELTYLQNLVQVLLAALHPKLMVIGETPITH